MGFVPSDAGVPGTVSVRLETAHGWIEGHGYMKHDPYESVRAGKEELGCLTERVDLVQDSYARRA